MDDRGPLSQVGQPAQDAVRREDDVEFFVQHVGQVVHVGADEAGVSPNLVVQGASEVYGGVGEVDAGGLRAETRP